MKYVSLVRYLKRLFVKTGQLEKEVQKFSTQDIDKEMTSEYVGSNQQPCKVHLQHKSDLEKTGSLPVSGELEKTASIKPHGTSPSMAAFHKNLAAFKTMRDQLIKTKYGLYVAICDEQVVDEDKDKYELLRRVSEKYRFRFPLLRYVTSQNESEVVVEMPTTEIIWR